MRPFQESLAGTRGWQSLVFYGQEAGIAPRGMGRWRPPGIPGPVMGGNSSGGLEDELKSSEEITCLAQKDPTPQTVHLVWPSLAEAYNHLHKFKTCECWFTTLGWGCKGALEVSWPYSSARAGCPGLCSDSSYVSPGWRLHSLSG